tara:strand:+ start:1412 stop:1612 length:201 start_codon:yes stop_codon:yes gene_type:complete
MIIKNSVHYEQQRTCRNDNNNGFLYGIYYYDVPSEDLNTDNIYNNNIVRVEWYKTEKERDVNLNTL